MTHVHDVAIVGGGLVGASLAIALDGAGIDTVLVEAGAAGAPPAVFDERNLSFAEATVHALAALGVLAKLQAPAGLIRRIHASRAGDFGRVLLDAADHGREAFGRVVVARDFGLALEARLAELPRLRRLRPARFVALADGDPGLRTLRIEGDDGPGEVRARLLVGADGARSGVRDALGIGAASHDYGTVLLVARLRAGRAPDGTAWERLGPHGPTALLPRGDGHYGLVHAVPAGDAPTIAALDDAAFLARIQHEFGWRAGRFTAVGPRSVHPLQRVMADATTAPRAALVGNAAQAIHPVGAQGFNLGLRDALVLAECIAGGPGDAGAPAVLQAYAARRADDRARTVAFADALAGVGGSALPGASLLRSAAMAALDRAAFARAWLVGGAMGYGGDVPALCRGDAA